jgi:cell division transport system permease protein
MKGSLRYMLVRAIQNMRRNLFPNVTTIGVIAISALIFSTFSLIAFNVASFLKIWEDKIEVIAYLKKKTPAGEIETLLDKMRGMGGIESVRYVSPTDAMVFMETRLGSQKNLLEGVQPTILPPSLEMHLQKEYRNSTKIREVVSELKQIPQIEEIQYGQEWVEIFSSVVHILRLTQWVLGGLLLVAMSFIISNTLLFTIASRREEIEIMQLVGASPSFIRVPFYIEGMIQGLLGAGLALLFLFLLQRMVLLYFPASIKDWMFQIPILFLPPRTLVGILGGGMVLGFLGSLMASMRLLRAGG